MKPFFARHWFTLSIPLAFALAWFAPDLARRGGTLRPEITTQLGVIAIFLLQGLTLPTQALRSGLTHTRFHLVVQGFVFIAFPLIGFAANATVGPLLQPDLRLGFLYLCILPSTISSASVLTATAGGNTAAAICAAIFSSLLSIPLTPLLASFALQSADHPVAFLPVVLSLLKLIVAPLIVGQLLRLTPLRAFAETRRKGISHFSTAIILFIVFAAFCDAAHGGLWTRHSPSLLLIALGGVIALFSLASFAVSVLTRAAKLQPADQRAAQFSAVQKSLATGVPMATLIFGAHPGLGLILLPLLIYHPLQLTLQGLLANRWAARPL